MPRPCGDPRLTGTPPRFPPPGASLTSAKPPEVHAFDVDRRVWVGAEGADGRGARAIPTLAGRLVADEQSVGEASRDLGRIVTARPGAVLRPADAGDVEAMVAFCAEHGIAV